MAKEKLRQFVQCQEDKVSRDNMPHPAAIWLLTFKVLSYIIGEMFKLTLLENGKKIKTDTISFQEAVEIMGFNKAYYFLNKEVIKKGDRTLVVECVA